LIEKFTIVRLESPFTIKSFDCTDRELNEFLSEDAMDHGAQLLSVTYLLMDGDEIMAYFSVLNDSIRHSDTSSNSELRKMLKQIPFAKRGYKSHPAVKVGRFAVNKHYQSKGIGSEVMTFIKGYFLNKNKTGCRFITVDANNNPRTIKFYQENGFDFLTKRDTKDSNRLMFFDLIYYANYLRSPAPSS
jgi:GNAT superfamily N-acetyltransferase